MERRIGLHVRAVGDGVGGDGDGIRRVFDLRVPVERAADEALGAKRGLERARFLGPDPPVLSMRARTRERGVEA